MTNFRIERIPFDGDALAVWAKTDQRHSNWPVVYTITADNEIYVGETLSAATRLNQHLSSPERKDLKHVRIVFNDTFNKSVCLDLESHLIRYLHADGNYAVLNRNYGITDADYFNRAEYRRMFDELFEELLQEGLLTRSIPDIVNSNLFKFSPFKALNTDQAVAVSSILETFFEDKDSGFGRGIVVQGEPGTGKTIVAIYLMKLLIDIAKSSSGEMLDRDTMFSDFFTDYYRNLLADFRVALVVPQQSLRRTIQTVFSKTPGLNKNMVLTPFEVGESEQPFDLLIVDEAHRLGQRSNQPAASLNAKFSQINQRLFGADRDTLTQLDWIKAQSRHQVLLIDSLQSVKPADLPARILETVISEARELESYFHLASQMRVAGGNDYITFIGDVLSGQTHGASTFGEYEFRMFEDIREMRQAILDKEEKCGLARMVAGFAWPWVSKTDPDAPDIEIDGLTLFWNRTATDWINSETSIEEVGSIHTVQGYDLNYAGVIIGSDLAYDPAAQRLVFRRENYHDKKGKENNKKLGIQYTDDDLLGYVVNIYRVLLTRGIRGTYVYVCDPHLRQYFRDLFAG